MILKRINTNLDLIHDKENLHNTSNINKEESEKDFVFIKANQSLVRVKYSDISYIEGLKDYVKVYVGLKPLITKCTIKHLEKKLPKANFIRIHKSYIVSVSQIVKVEFNHVFILQKQIPIGQLYKESFQHLIKNHSL